MDTYITQIVISTTLILIIVLLWIRIRRIRTRKLHKKKLCNIIATAKRFKLVDEYLPFEIISNGTNNIVRDAFGGNDHGIEVSFFTARSEGDRRQTQIYIISERRKHQRRTIKVPIQVESIVPTLTEVITSPKLRNL